MNKRLPNLLMLMTIYLAACLSMQACSSMTDRVLKPSSLQKGSSYAEIRVKSANGISGAPMGFSTDDDLAYSKWEMIDGGDSAMKQVGKTLFSITPQGMTTNLIHRKGLLGATVYHLPTGEVNILVFNYFRTPKGENGHWGAELKAYLEPGRKYILRPKELAASSSHSGKLYALVVLEDESGNNVVRDYSFFTPLDQIGMKSISYDTTYYDEMDDKHKSLTGAIGMTIGSEMGLFIDEWNLFVQDVKAGKYDQEETWVKKLLLRIISFF